MCSCLRESIRAARETKAHPAKTVRAHEQSPCTRRGLQKHSAQQQWAIAKRRNAPILALVITAPLFFAIRLRCNCCGSESFTMILQENVQILFVDRLPLAIAIVPVAQNQTVLWNDGFCLLPTLLLPAQRSCGVFCSVCPCSPMLRLRFLFCIF